MSSVVWVLGIDPGKHKTGVAIGQSLTASAQPLAIVHQPLAQLAADAFAGFVREWRPRIIVVGMPTLADGKAHPLTRDITSLITRLEESFALPVYTHSEFLSSHEARKRDTKRRHIDDLAATLILESWLSEYQGTG